MIHRRVTVSLTLANFKVVIVLSETFTVRALKCSTDISKVRQAKSDDLKAWKGF